MKKLVLAICVGFCIAASVICTVNETEDALANGVIRLHIRANSNSEDDQALKLKVRDRLISESKKMMQKDMSIDDVRSYARQNLTDIRAIAIDEIRKNGYDYDVNVKFGKSEFPVKTYGDMTLPAGTYEALVVEIGASEGENWWCVMFPPFCTSAAADTAVFSDGQWRTMTAQMPDVTVRFKLLEWWQALKSLF